MTRGCLMFAHNGTIDYGSQAVLSARLANHYLSAPVSLITDAETLSDIHSKFDTLPFDQIIEVDKPKVDNYRILNSQRESFLNSNRYNAYNLTPYDRTLLIDTDFLIFSNKLSNYWDSNKEFLITIGMNDLTETRYSPNAYSLNNYSIPMVWATNVMFSKTPEVKMFFDLVEHVRDEFEYYSQIYEFSADKYRNDFAFSIACHIMSNHGTVPWHGALPTPLYFKDCDRIIKINDLGKLVMLSKQIITNKDFLIKCENQDVHILNKNNLIENIENILGYIQ